MRVYPICQRLIEEVPSLRQAIPAASGAIPASYPAAYVYTESRTAGLNQIATQATSQRLEVRVAVELMVRHAGEAASGGPAAELLEDVLEQVDAALLGWSPDQDHAPLELVGGRIVAVEPGLVTWRDTWRTSRLLRSV